MKSAASITSRHGIRLIVSLFNPTRIDVERPCAVRLDVRRHAALERLPRQHNRLMRWLQRRPESAAKVQRLRESRTEQPRETVADLEPGILQPARHPVIC